MVEKCIEGSEYRLFIMNFGATEQQQKIIIKKKKSTEVPWGFWLGNLLNPIQETSFSYDHTARKRPWGRSVTHYKANALLSWKFL